MVFSIRRPSFTSFDTTATLRLSSATPFRLMEIQGTVPSTCLFIMVPVSMVRGALIGTWTKKFIVVWIFVATTMLVREISTSPITSHKSGSSVRGRSVTGLALGR